MVDLLIDFRSRGWSGSAETVGPWRDITCDVMGASWTRGSPEHRGLLNTPEAGSASIALIDKERDLDPANSAGIYYGQIDVGCDLRLRFGGRQVFIGRIVSIKHQFQYVGVDVLAVANIAVDGYQSKLALIPAIACSNDAWVSDTYPDEITSARINRILNYCDVPTANRDIESGGAFLLDMDKDGAVAAGTAWDLLVLSMVAELGSIEITTDGKIRTRNRNTVWGTNPSATLHLGCCAHAGVIPIYEAEYEMVRDSVRNDVRLTATETDDKFGPMVDNASIAKYGLRKFDSEVQIYFDSTNADGWLNYFLARMKSPMKSWRLTLRPTTQTEIDAIETVFLYTSRAHVVIDDVGGALIDKQLRPVGLGWSVDPEGMVCTLVLGDGP